MIRHATPAAADDSITTAMIVTKASLGSDTYAVTTAEEVKSTDTRMGSGPAEDNGKVDATAVTVLASAALSKSIVVVVGV